MVDDKRSGVQRINGGKAVDVRVPYQCVGLVGLSARPAFKRTLRPLAPHRPGRSLRHTNTKIAGHHSQHLARQQGPGLFKWPTHFYTLSSYFEIFLARTWSASSGRGSGTSARGLSRKRHPSRGPGARLDGTTALNRHQVPSHDTLANRPLPVPRPRGRGTCRPLLHFPHKRVSPVLGLSPGRED